MQRRRHYYKPDFLSQSITDFKTCLVCLGPKDAPEHVPIPARWREAMYLMASVGPYTRRDSKLYIFRPYHITKFTQLSATPLNGGNVARGLRAAGFAEPLEKGLVPPPGGRPKRGIRPRASWYRLTPAGWEWLLTGPVPASGAVRQALTGASARRVAGDLCAGPPCGPMALQRPCAAWALKQCGGLTGGALWAADFPVCWRA